MNALKKKIDIESKIDHGLNAMAIRLNRKISDRYKELTERELEILLNVFNGLTNNVIVNNLYISPKNNRSPKIQYLQKDGFEEFSTIGNL